MIFLAKLYLNNAVNQSDNRVTALTTFLTYYVRVVFWLSQLMQALFDQICLMHQELFDNAC